MSSSSVELKPRYIEANTENLRNKYDMMMLDPSRTKHMSIPDEMFDKKMGWRLFNYQPTELEKAPED